MHAALAQVKNELGPEAVILNTKTFHHKGFLGFGKREFVEILASNTVNIADTPPPFTRQQKEYERHHVGSKTATKAAVAEPRGGEILKELTSLKTQVELLAREYVQDPQYPSVLNDRYQRLLKAGISKLLAKEVVGAVHTELSKSDLENPEIVAEKLGRELGKLIRLRGPITCNGRKARAIVMTGPTGVGKTTTIAKLAALYSIKEKRQVSLITADTYRIAAVEQLKVYADIIGVTLDVVLTPKELRQAVLRNSNKDLVFIDTAGRSQQDQTRLVELKNFIEAAEPDENHLVISATTDKDEVFNIIDKFGCAEISSFIFSKVDECTSPGIIFNVLSSSDKPVSYVTTGQDVPDDIELASEKGLLDLLFRKSEK